jgi:hypothetical protein
VALQRQEKAAKQLERRQNKVRRILVAEHVTTDPECSRLASEICQVKELRHRHRLNIARKDYSIGLHRTKIEQVERKLIPLREEDQRLSTQLDELALQQRQATDHLVARVMAEMGDRKLT